MFMSYRGRRVVAQTGAGPWLHRGRLSRRVSGMRIGFEGCCLMHKTGRKRFGKSFELAGMRGMRGCGDAANAANARAMRADICE